MISSLQRKGNVLVTADCRRQITESSSATTRAHDVRNAAGREPTGVENRDGLLRWLGQPQVVGEMLAGIVLGPSVLGWIAPGAYALLFPIGSVRFVGALSQLGLMLFMFLVGLELRPEDLRGSGSVRSPWLRPRSTT